MDREVRQAILRQAAAKPEGVALDAIQEQFPGADVGAALIQLRAQGVPVRIRYFADEGGWRVTLPEAWRVALRAVARAKVILSGKECVHGGKH